jgi:branched-chain amino acid transport system substrate-binding protein
MVDEFSGNGRLSIDRRRALQLAGASALVGFAPLSRARASTPRPIKIGYVSPQTGPLAPIGEVDEFILKGVREALKGGVANPAGKYPIEIIVKDSQSNPNRAAEVAGELILQDDIDLMVVGATPENSNPVCDQCELNGVPCISTTTPWQPWFFGRGGDPAKGFQWTYHYFWGIEDIIEVFTSIWNQVPTNKKIGLFLANDGDGNAWGDPKTGIPPVLTKMGFTVFDPGRFQPLQQDFSAQIAAYKKEGVEIVCGVPIPPDFKNFWTQARQQGFHPKAVTMGKAYSFPSVMESMGDQGYGLSQELWWTPTNPFKSSLTGLTSAQLAKDYEAATGRQWNGAIGFAHSMFELVADVVKRAKDPTDKAFLRDAIIATKLDSTVGHIDWSKGPMKNVCKTPLVAGQWVKGQKHPYDLIVVANTEAPEIPVAAKPIAIPY